MRLLFLLCLCWVSPAHAVTPAGEVATSVVFLNRKPIQVTGQLAPFRFLVNDRLIFERPRSYTELSVNNIKVRLTATEEDKTSRFFKFETDADTLTLVAKTWNGDTDDFKLRLPKVVSAKWDGEQVIFKVEHNSDYVAIDNQRETVHDDKIEWITSKPREPHELLMRGEGMVPDSRVEFQVVSKSEYKAKLAQKKREEKKNKNRLLANKKETWLDRVEWNQVEVNLGMRLGPTSALAFGASLAPHYAYSPTFGLRGLIGATGFSGTLGLELGARAGFRFTYALPFAPLRLEVGPSAYLFNQGIGLAAAVEALALYELPGKFPPLDALGLSYSLWLKPTANTLHLVAQLKF